MPYSSTSDVPTYVPAARRKRWLEVFNSAYDRAKKDGKSDKDAEASAFAQANAVAGPNAKVLVSSTGKAEKHNHVDVGYEKDSTRPGQTCSGCAHFEPPASCEGVVDPIAPTGWCLRYEAKEEKAMEAKFRKFIPFCKVDASKREVWGIVTAEVPDKEDEVCDYARSKPYYEALIAEMAKATENENFMPLRQMHSTDLPVAGKGIGYEFRDADREVFFGFKVTDDKAWKNVEERVYTGFSHGGFKVGEMEPDPVFKGCYRYVANPAEVSLVDNPCLGVAHFTYVSKTGEVTMRKNRSVEDPASARELRKQLAELSARVEQLAKAGTAAAKGDKEKTKRVAGEDLPASAFLLVGDKEKTETWHLPVKFSSDAKTKRHIRNALARIDQVRGISDAAREAARKKLHGLAEQHGVDVADEKKKLAAVRGWLRKAVRARVNRLQRKVVDIGPVLTFVDDDLGRVAKGMFEVSRLAQVVDGLASLCHGVCWEQEWEGDLDSPLPGMLGDNVGALLDTLVALVAEETCELRDEVAEHLEALAAGTTR